MQASGTEAEELGQYQQLIELQRQIVEMAEKNAATRQRCARLREQLEREFVSLAGLRRPVRDRLREAATGVLGRLLKRPDEPPETRRSPGY